jgi:hypothetical protein
MVVAPVTPPEPVSVWRLLALLPCADQPPVTPLTSSVAPDFTLMTGLAEIEPVPVRVRVEWHVDKPVFVEKS